MTHIADNLHVIIISWHGMRDKALHIATEIAQTKVPLSVIYSNKSETEENGPGNWIKVSQDLFFGPKFQRALELCANHETMLLVQADAVCENWGALVQRCHQVTSKDREIAIWAPEIDNTPYRKSVTSLGVYQETNLIEVAQTDGIVTAFSPSILDRLKHLDYKDNQLGWGIDWAAITIARDQNKMVLCDTAVSVHHPVSRNYADDTAQEQMERFLKQLSEREIATYTRLSTLVKTRQNQVYHSPRFSVHIPKKLNSMTVFDHLKSPQKSILDIASFVMLLDGRLLLRLAPDQTIVSSPVISYGDQKTSLHPLEEPRYYFDIPKLLHLDYFQNTAAQFEPVDDLDWGCDGLSTSRIVATQKAEGAAFPLAGAIDIPANTAELWFVCSLAVHRANADLKIEFISEDGTEDQELYTKFDSAYTGARKTNDFQQVRVRIPRSEKKRKLQLSLCYWGTPAYHQEKPPVMFITQPVVFASPQMSETLTPIFQSGAIKGAGQWYAADLDRTHSALDLCIANERFAILAPHSAEFSLLKKDSSTITINASQPSEVILYLNGLPYMRAYTHEGRIDFELPQGFLSSADNIVELCDPSGTLLYSHYRPAQNEPAAREKSTASPSARHPNAWAIDALFDTEFYRSGFAKGTAPEDGASHYLTEGCEQGRDPAPWFSSWHYLAQHPDVQDAKMNPFLHYALAGQKEDRALAPLGTPTTIDETGPFAELFSKATGARSAQFAPLTNRKAVLKNENPKTIAFYLPQFHAIAENDEWWGKGFTEWTNVSKAVPQFSGHHQPRLPGELGYYDLKQPEIIARQIELAQQFGIHGFCFHYYWFAGHRLLEKPLDLFLNSGDEAFNFPFCLCWANENWTRRWDGAEHDVLMQQTHNAEDHLAVFDDMLRYLKDPRYITVDNRPVVVVYRPDIIDDLPAMVNIWREQARESGFDDIFLVATNAFGFEDHASIGFDAICEFPPHNVTAHGLSNDIEFYNANFDGKVFSYTDARDFSLQRLERKLQEPKADQYFPSVMMGWDNEARKPGRGNIFKGADPKEFHKWVSGALEYSQKAHTQNSSFVFINAWNEWGEGTYLEPDRWFGYGYLNAVAAAYDTLNATPVSKPKRLTANSSVTRKRNVIFLHAFYSDVLADIAEQLERPWIRDQFDIIATVPLHWSQAQRQQAHDLLETENVLTVPNAGRDMYPFMHALQTIELSDYEVALKLHTKKSPHLQHGARWQKSILDCLTNQQDVEIILQGLSEQQELGLVAPRSLFMPVHDQASLRDNRESIEAISKRYNLSLSQDSEFVAGSMFWFRPAALQSLLEDPLTIEDFGIELGAIDGTVAHALERLLPTFIQKAGYKSLKYDNGDAFNPYR